MADSSLRRGQIGPPRLLSQMRVGVSVTSNKCTRHKHACAPMFFCSCVPVLPDGVIGNTWAFGAHVPGSSPGRVVLKLKVEN